ncbi:hypothetical protein TKK_0014424 [Trichogramma kaykai]
MSETQQHLGDENNRNVLNGLNGLPDDNLIQEEPEGIQVIKTNLREYIEKQNDGKDILYAYEICKRTNRPLKKEVRSQLARLVIKREKDWILRDVPFDQMIDKFVISTTRLEILAIEIQDIFPLENSETYFTPFRKEGKKSILCSGKLWDHYNYQKTSMKSKGRLRSNKNKNDVIPVPVSNEELNNINWLKQNIAPWNEVLTRWNNTFEARKTGRELFLLDFDKLHQGHDFIGNDKWSLFQDRLIQQFTTDKIKEANELGIIGCLKSGCLAAGKRKPGELKSEPIRLSMRERRESFIFHVEIVGEVEKKLLDYKNRLNKSKSAFQPLIVAAGSIYEIQKYYLAVNKKLYEIDSCMEAIIVVLKVYFALDCEYPLNTKPIWTFLQRILLALKVNGDFDTPDMKILFGVLKDIIKV